MFEKGKTYAYDEIEDILAQGSLKTLEELDKQTNGKMDASTKMMLQMHNMMVVSQFVKVLTKGDSDEDNK